MGETEVRLSPKQEAVCRLVVQGMSNKEIAIELGISHRTVDSHREAAYRRLNVRNTIELVKKFLATEGAA